MECTDYPDHHSGIAPFSLGVIHHIKMEHIHEETHWHYVDHTDR